MQDFKPQMPMQPCVPVTFVHFWPAIHLTRIGLKAPVLKFLTRIVQMPALLGNQLALQYEEALVAVVGLTVGVEPLLPAFVESAVIHICTSKDFRFSITAE